MARKASDEPLEKVTLKLFASDVELMRKAYGWGYSTVIRNWVRAQLGSVRQHAEGTEDE